MENSITKKCSKCGENKLPHEMKKDNKRPDGFSSHCKTCHNENTNKWREKNPEKVKTAQQKYRDTHKYEINRYYERNKDASKNFSYQRLYGITIQDYNSLLNKQGGGCEVCGKPPKTRRLYVDHNHSNKKVRGLLCHNCNAALGHVKDEVSILKKLIEYIEKYNA